MNLVLSQFLRRVSRVQAVLLACSLSITAIAVVAWGGTPQDETRRPSPIRDVAEGDVALIDAPARDRVAPRGSVVDVKAVYGAKGDGRTDDTAAIQRAISDGLGWSSEQKIVYFPAGTYVVSSSLEWRLSDGTWSTWLTLMGQNRDKTIIKLKDSAPGFADPADSRSVIVTGSDGSDMPNGSGNRAFHNFIFDLTVDVGRGNPGANGIDYLANNRGSIRNVVVRAAPGSGNTGITMTRRWPGPCLLQDVRISGFTKGITITHWEYSVTAESIRLSGQREVGIENGNNVLSIRDLVSHNSVPAVRNGSPTSRDSTLVLVDSTLHGEKLGAVAVVNDGNVFVRAVTTPGYGAPVRERGEVRFPDLSAEWTSPSSTGQNAGRSRAETQTVGRTPSLPEIPESQWAGVEDHGAVAGDSADDTAGIQKALDSGARVIHFRPGWFHVSRTLRVPPSVEAIVGFEASIDATRGVFADDSEVAVFQVDSGGTRSLYFSQLIFKASPQVVDIERAGSRPIALEHVHIGGRPFRGSSGPLFLTDVEGGNGWAFESGHRVVARQLNAEQGHTKIRNAGGDLWILGLKTERVGTAIESTNGARTELLGGLLYPAARFVKSVPAFAGVNSDQSLVFAVSAGHPTHRYDPLVVSSHGDRVESLTPGTALRRGLHGSVVLLYTSRQHEMCEEQEEDPCLDGN